VWDYGDIAAQIARAEAGCRNMQPASLVLCLCALSQMDWRGQWDNDGILSDAEYDNVEAWVARAYIDLTTSVDCGGIMLPIGSIFAWPTRIWPDNTLPCDGYTLYDREDYPDLYDALDPVFRVDEDTFRTPNIQERVIIGYSEDYAVGDTGGEAEHVLTVDEMPAHTHGISSTSAVADAGSTRVIPGSGDFKQSSSVGGDEAHNNMQPYITLRWVIVALDG
jgi:microcystin-dependent protein